jgi:hypothetical protein
MKPVFEDDKKKMEQQELEMDREITRWRRLYEDILPVFWGETEKISHSAYEEMDRMIVGGFPDYKF